MVRREPESENLNSVNALSCETDDETACRYRVAVLGPLAVHDAGGDGVVLPNGRQATVLASLALAEGASVSDDVVIERIWPTGAPRHAVASLRNVVAELRKVLGGDAVARTANGYRLDVSLCGLDVHRFRELVDDARRLVSADDRAGAVRRLDDALALVRGRPFGAIGAEPWALPTVVAIDDEIARAEEFWADQRLGLGQIDRETERLRLAARDRPHREIRWTQLVRALADAGRRAEALRALSEARLALAEFGLAPGPNLLDVERTIIGEPAPSARLIPIRRGPLVGRDTAMLQLLAGAPFSWIEADSGLGKTRLLAELADRRAEWGEATLYVACQRHRDLLLPSLITQARQQLGLPAAPAGVEPAGDASAPDGSAPDGVIRRARMLDELTDLLAQCGTRAPTTVIVDDVQWLAADTGTDLTSLVSQPAPGLRWVFAGRPTEHGLAATLLHGHLCRAGDIATITLDPLDESQLAALAALEVPDLDDPQLHAIAADVFRSTHGHPLFATELIRYRTDAGSAGGLPPRLEAIVGATLGHLSTDERHVVELLSAAGSPLAVTVIARASGIGPITLLDVVERLRAEGLVDGVPNDTVDFRHELLRDAVAANVSVAKSAERRRELIDALRGDREHLPLSAGLHLAPGYHADGDLLAERDDVVVRALDLLVSNGEFGPANALAERYLDLDHPADAPLSTVRARVAAARVLVASGDNRRGVAELVELLDVIRTRGEPTTHADVLLAFGPLATGSRLHGTSFLDEAVAVAEQLPVAEVARRVQLRCWISHHRLGNGNRDDVVADIDELIESLADEPDLRWLGLALAVRAQADTLAGASPGESTASATRLRALTRRTADIGTHAADAILHVGEAFASGTLDDVAEARSRIESIAVRLPRPDVRWWPHAVDASLALASKGRAEADDAIAVAEAAGQRLGVDLAPGVAMSQRLLGAFQADALGGFADVLRMPAADPAANSAVIATYGLASAAIGDRDEAVRIAHLLAARSDLLAGEGPSWPLVALLAAELAAAVGDQELAGVLQPALAAHSGRGLSMNGLAYVGTADRLLGMLAHVAGDNEAAGRLLSQAVRQEERRGADVWVTLTRRTAVALGLN
jgi:DNA-binding SARP family transcriptional activator